MKILSRQIILAFAVTLLSAKGAAASFSGKGGSTKWPRLNAFCATLLGHVSPRKVNPSVEGPQPQTISGSPREPMVAFGDTPLEQGDYLYHLSVPGRSPNTTTYLKGENGISCCGLDDDAYVENLSSYREDVNNGKRSGSLAFDLERVVHVQEGRAQFSLMLTATYTSILRGPSRDEFIARATLMPGFVLRHQEIHRVHFENPQGNIFVNWLNIDGEITVGAISLQLRPTLEEIISSELPEVLKAFGSIWPGRLPDQSIVEKSVQVARESNKRIPAELKLKTRFEN